MALAAIAGVAPMPAGAQTALAAAIIGRSTPGGVSVLALRAGTKVAVGAAKGADVLITIDGWVEGSRLAGKIDTFPASVDANGALRIHATPSPKGAILGELHSRVGAYVLGKSGSWAHVKRSVWVPVSALPKSLAAKPEARKPEARKPEAPKPAAARADPSPAQAAAAAGQDVVPGAMSASSATALLAAPGGKPLGDLAAGAIVQPLAHDHGWSKVRVEGWVADRSLAPADTSLGSQLTAADLRADPEGTHGKMVQWDVQVLSLQTADPLRPELARDEPYLLAKGPGAEDALLYLAVPPSLLAQAGAIPPLTRVLITARVRSGHSEPVGIPILDLRSIAKR
jgi:hypothetical protein